MNLKLKLVLLVLFLFGISLNAKSHAAKPRIMVFPANVWMTEKQYVLNFNNQGSSVQVMDYQKAMNSDKDLYSVINKIGALMKDRGFPLEDLGASLKQISEQGALNNMDQDATGAGISESPRDKLLKVAKPDIILEVNWTVNNSGLKKSVTFDLKGIDAATNKQIASASGTGENLSISAALPVMLETAVIANLDNFNVQLMSHFTDMFENGREITLDVKVWDSSPKKLNDEINQDGDELKDDLKKWVKNNTVKGRFTLSNSSPNFLKFTQVRIPMFDESGTAYDADAFAAKLRKYLRKTYQLQSESSAIGLGLAEVIIGGKR
jgi:hypothetical protein